MSEHEGVEFPVRVALPAPNASGWRLDLARDLGATVRGGE